MLIIKKVKMQQHTGCILLDIFAMNSSESKNELDVDCVINTHLPVKLRLILPAGTCPSQHSQ